MALATSCAECGAPVGVDRGTDEHEGLTVLRCIDEACGHQEPIPAGVEVELAGGDRLPGFEEG